TTQNQDNTTYCDFVGGAECPPDVGKPLGTKLTWTPSVPQEYTRFYSVSVWGSGSRAPPTTMATAQAYDSSALTDTNLVDASTCPLNASLGPCASSSGNGWFLAHNQTVTGQPRTPGDEKTGSAALVLAGCALWNTLLPNNPAGPACHGTLPAANARGYPGGAPASQPPRGAPRAPPAAALS